MQREQEEASRADNAVLVQVVLRELHKIGREHRSKGRRIALRSMMRAVGEGPPTEVSFQVMGKKRSSVYEIKAHNGSVMVVQKNNFELGGGHVISDKVDIRWRRDLTAANVRRLIMRAITECESSGSC